MKDKIKKHFFSQNLFFWGFFISISLVNAQAAENGSGNKISLVPPKDFLPYSDGYILPENNSTITIDQSWTPFTEATADFTASELANKGMRLVSVEEIRVANYPGLFLNANWGDYTRWILTFGNHQETVVLTATFPQDISNESVRAIKNSLLSLQWNPDPVTAGLFTGLTFKIKDHPALKFAKRLGNSLVLTSDGTFPQSTPNAPILMIGAFFTENVPLSEPREFSMDRLEKTDQVSNIQVSRIEPIRIAGLPGYEILGTGKHHISMEDTLVYQVTLFGPTDYYVLQGIVKTADQQRYYPAFKQIAASFTQN